MYDLTADIYDLIYSHKDYAAEAAWVRHTIRARTPEARTLLDVACGTGAHLEHLRSDFICRGVDLNERFVEIAQTRTGVSIDQANMDCFDLGERFDAVVCLFSAIGYSADLDAAIASMRRHVAPGGLVIIEPWFAPDEWIDGHVSVLDHDSNGTRVVRMSTSARDGNVAVMEMHHLIGTAAGVEHLVETHRLTLFTFDEYEGAFRNAGLTYELDRPGPFGRGALIGQA